MKIFFLLGSIAGFLAIALGAFGAHGLEGKISEKMLQVWKTGVTYQMFATGMLFIVGFFLLKIQQSSLLPWAGWLTFAGILLFSGSLYVLSVTGIKWIGAITPLGGVAFLVGWVLIGVAVVKHF